MRELRRQFWLHVAMGLSTVVVFIIIFCIVLCVSPKAALWARLRWATISVLVGPWACTAIGLWLLWVVRACCRVTSKLVLGALEALDGFTYEEPAAFPFTIPVESKALGMARVSERDALQRHVAKRRVSITAIGNSFGVGSLELKLQNKSTHALRVVLPRGTYFHSLTPGFQPLVTLTTFSEPLDAREVRTLTLDAFCGIQSYYCLRNQSLGLSGYRFEREAAMASQVTLWDHTAPHVKPYAQASLDSSYQQPADHRPSTSTSSLPTPVPPPRPKPVLPEEENNTFKWKRQNEKLPEINQVAYDDEAGRISICEPLPTRELDLGWQRGQEQLQRVLAAIIGEELERLMRPIDLLAIDRESLASAIQLAKSLGVDVAEAEAKLTAAEEAAAVVLALERLCAPWEPLDIDVPELQSTIDKARRLSVPVEAALAKLRQAEEALARLAEATDAKAALDRLLLVANVLEIDVVKLGEAIVRAEGAGVLVIDAKRRLKEAVEAREAKAELDRLMSPTDLLQVDLEGLRQAIRRASRLGIRVDDAQRKLQAAEAAFKAAEDLSAAKDELLLLCQPRAIDIDRVKLRGAIAHAKQMAVEGAAIAAAEARLTEAEMAWGAKEALSLLLRPTDLLTIEQDKLNDAIALAESFEIPVDEAKKRLAAARQAWQANNTLESLLPRKGKDGKGKPRTEEPKYPYKADNETWALWNEDVLRAIAKAQKMGLKVQWANLAHDEEKKKREDWREEQERGEREGVLFVAIVCANHVPPATQQALIELELDSNPDARPELLFTRPVKKTWKDDTTRETAPLKVVDGSVEWSQTFMYHFDDDKVASNRSPLTLSIHAHNPRFSCARAIAPMLMSSLTLRILLQGPRVDAQEHADTPAVECA